MIVQLYIKRRTPQSDWMRSSKTLVPFHSRQSNCLVFFFFLSLFFPEHCAGSGSGKLETETTFIVHCQCLTADTELVAFVGCSSPFLSECDFFFLLVLVLVLRTRCQLQWGMSSVGFVQSMELSVWVAASLRPSRCFLGFTLSTMNHLSRFSLQEAVEEIKDKQSYNYFWKSN